MRKTGLVVLFMFMLTVIPAVAAQPSANVRGDAGLTSVFTLRGISVVNDKKNDWLYSPSGNPAIGPSYIDITRTEIIQCGKYMKMIITVARNIPTAPSSNHVWYAFFLDTDKNPSTGIAGLDINDLGVDVSVELHYIPGQGWYAQIYDFITGNSVTLTSSQYSVSCNRIEFRIPVGSFKSFNWVAVAKDYGSEDPWGGNYIFDHCPNSGHAAWCSWG